MKYTEQYIREVNNYLDNLNVTDNELIRAGCQAGYAEEIVQALVYTDDVEQVIADNQ